VIRNVQWMSRAELEAELEARGKEPIGEKDELQVRPAGSMPLSLCAANRMSIPRGSCMQALPPQTM